MNTHIYCISYNNIIRKNNMINKYKNIGLELKFINNISLNDPRMNINGNQKTSHIMLQHLNCIKDFLDNSEANYCIICEDDIFISKNFKRDLPIIQQKFNEHNLDILLLGYLFPFPNNDNFELICKFEYMFNKYNDNLWGTQMYMISRKYAKFIINNYFCEDKIRKLKTHFAADWTITKNGNRAILYPMVAVEDGNNISGDSNQDVFHKKCFDLNYDPNLYI